MKVIHHVDGNPHNNHPENLGMKDSVESSGPTAPEDPLLPMWLPTWMDKGLLISGLALLALHHHKSRDQSIRHATDEGAELSGYIARHHQEQLYQIGEQIALLGGRNAYPRPSKASA